MNLDLPLSLRRRALAPLLIGAALATCPVAHAAPWFTVEVVVFEHLAEDNYREEVWPADPGTPELTDTVELIPGGGGDGMPQPFTVAPRDQWTLNGIYAALRRSSDYRPLLHMAWLQPVPGPGSATAVHLHPESGLRYPAPPDEGAPGELPPLVLTDESVPPPSVEGRLRLHRSRFLHVHADLLHYREPERLPSPAPSAGPGPAPSAQEPATADETGNGDGQEMTPAPTPVTQFRMQQKRRMRAEEIHYLDHPLLGVIVRVSPFQLPEGLEPAGTGAGEGPGTAGPGDGAAPGPAAGATAPATADPGAARP